MSFDDFNSIDPIGGRPEEPQSAQGFDGAQNSQPVSESAPVYSGDTVTERFRQPPVQPYGDDERRGMWSEPVYESADNMDRDAYSPGRYAYGAQNVPSAPPEKPPKKKKSHGFLKAAALVVVCALVAGASSWLVVDYMLDKYAAPGGGNRVVLGSSMSSYKAMLDSAPRVDGQVLTGNQISLLGDRQVVGINSTNQTTNFFGQTTTRAVSGSGFIISEDGYILTNYHVISYAVVYGYDLTVMTKDGTKYDAEIVGYLESNDVAVIKIDAQGLSPAVIGDSDQMLVGEPVYAIGNPLGELDYSMADGIISALDREITTADDIPSSGSSSTPINMFQITAAVNHGNSGGPVYNSRGEVIGIVTAKYADAEEGIEGLGFAIPINDAMAIATQLIETGHVASAGLGIQGLNVTDFYREFAIERYEIPSGVYVETVNPGSAAEKAGIQVGDIITAIDGKTVSTMDELKLALRRYSPGDSALITVTRFGPQMLSSESLDLNITFDELVEEPADTSQQPQQEPDYDYGDWPFSGWPW